MKASKWFLITAALCAVTGTFTGAVAQTSPIKVSMWFHSGQGGERDALSASVKRFNAANKDIQIEAVQLPEGSYGDQVNAAALANKLPCVLDFDGPNLYNYAWSGKIVALDKYVDAATRKDFLPSILKQGTYNKKLYSLGQFDSGLAIWGNRALLEKAGVKIPTGLSGAWSTSQLEGALAALKKSGLRYPLDMKFNYGQGEWFTYGFAPIMQSFGGDLISKDLKKASGTLNGAAAVRGMSYFQKLVGNYVNAATKSDADFIEGKAALSFVGHWAYADYKKALGKDLVLIPMPKFGGRAVTGSGSWNFGLSSNCANPDAAAKVLLHLVDTDEVLAMSEASGAVPSRYSAITKSTLFNPGEPLRVYVDQLQKIAKPRPATPAYPAISKAFAQAVANIAAGGNVQSELDKAAKAVDQDIEDNRGYPVK